MDSHEMKNQTIKVSELREVFNAILDNIETQLCVNAVRIDKDFYYCVPDEFKYNMATDPPNYHVGQLFDDWDFLKSIAQDKTLATPLNFMHLAPILDYLATQVNWFATKLPPSSSNDPMKKS